MEPAREPLLRARGLTRRFGARVAVDSLDLELRAGEAVAVFGANGAGKTTLLRLLAGSLRPTSGTLTIGGTDPRRAGPEIRSRVGFLSHQAGLYDDLSARDNLRFFARLHGVPDPGARADVLLRDLGLASRGDDSVRVYSRGMLQRVALARALVHDPPLLLLDEPFSGLDPVAAEGLREMLGAFRGAGGTLVHTTHVPEDGLRLSERWIFLSRGRVTETGRSDEEGRARLLSAYRAAAPPRPAASR